MKIKNILKKKNYEPVVCFLCFLYIQLNNNIVLVKYECDFLR